MTLPLSPANACRFADSSYATRGATRPGIAAAAALGVARELFDVEGSSVITGLTGPGARTNFGYVAFGQAGARQGECLIAVRGTNTVPDGLTDAYFSADRSPSGHLVHKGFNLLANSILPQVHNALQGRNPAAIHIVGHSLGGAAAALLADSLKEVANTRLYSFGAPRAGTVNHSNHLTQQLGAGNIFRVYHDTDPIPMVPLFPYTHAPTGNAGYLLTGSGMIVSPSAHSLSLYQGNVGEAWNGLATIPHRRFSLDTVDDVLKMAADVPGGLFSSMLMRLIVRALKLIIQASGMIVGTGLFAFATVVDQIALILTQGVRFVAAGMEVIGQLVQQIMRFLGIVVTQTVSITTAFMRWILSRLFSTIASMATMAIHAI